MVLALQTYTGFSRFAAENAIANVVVLSVTRELGPVIAGLMVAGRIGAAIAAEIGTMRVTDQIDERSQAVGAERQREDQPELVPQPASWRCRLDHLDGFAHECRSAVTGRRARQPSPAIRAMT